MRLNLDRRPSTKKATNGELFVNDVFYCYTLEDVVREKKIYGETAIPAGTYSVTLEPFRGDPKKMYPRLHNVPGFTGISVHAGNTADDSLGCILVGFKEAVDWVGDSKAALAGLCYRIDEAIKRGEEVKIVITDGKKAVS